MLPRNEIARVVRAAGVAALLCASAFGQRFEATDVHVSPPARNAWTWASGGVLRSERFDLRKATMLDLISTAWNIDPDTVIGGPNWLALDRFDVAGKAPPHTPPETIRLMLQALLKERFGLVVHQDTQPMPAYALRLVKGAKPKLQEPRADSPSGCEPIPGAATPTFSNARCRNVTMSEFAQWLRPYAGDYLRAPVVDSTGIEGRWDFELKWNWRTAILPPGATRVTIFDAIEKQLGVTLALETAPSPVLVVDRANEKPSPNPSGIDKIMPPRIVEFEVADLKPSRPEATGYSDGKLYPGGRLVMHAWVLKELIGYAFDMDFTQVDDLVSGVPRWAASARFDINAKPSAEIFGPLGEAWASDDYRLMVRNLLIERFQMKIHYEDRLVSAYSLVADKPGMKKADPSHRSSCKDARIVPNDPRDSNPMLSQLISCQNVTMAQFAVHLLTTGQFPFPVEDATGLTGNWDFMLSYTPRYLLQSQPPGNNSSASDPTGGVSLFDATSKQLGLKLERRKRMEPILVIDQMEQKPLEN